MDILTSEISKPDGWTAPLQAVLKAHRKLDGIEYIVHTRNCADGGCFEGHYTKNFAQALVGWRERCNEIHVPNDPTPPPREGGMEMLISLDFDGTCVTHEYPEIGKSIGAEYYLSQMVKHGMKLMLWTMRDGDTLEQAANWFRDRGIPLYGINENPDQASWTKSPKMHAELFIDDRGAGIPLKMDLKKSARPFVDWEALYPNFVLPLIGN